MKQKTSMSTPSPTSQNLHIETSIKNFSLDGVKTLHAEKILTTYRTRVIAIPEVDEPICSREIVKVSSQPMSFDLVKVTAEELLEYRKETPCFVLKKFDSLYLAVIPQNISFVSCGSFGEHKCGNCQRLSAASDAEGGCAKVRQRSNFIERYPWITYGIETFNTQHDAFIVFQCKNFSKFRAKRNVSVFEKEKMIVGLAQHICDNVESMAQVRKILKKNLGINKGKK